MFGFGSSLEPLMFTIFINDIFVGKLKGYADDLAVKYCSPDYNILYDGIQSEIRKLGDCFQSIRFNRSI